MPKFLIIAAPELCEKDFLGKISRLCEAGADKILLRAKYLSEEEFYALALEVGQICAKFEKEFIINHFFSVATKLGASFWLTSQQIKILANFDGQDRLNFQNPTLCYDELAKFKATSQSIYAPAHDEKQAEISAKFADVLVASHIFPTGCKADKTPKGVRLISDLKAKFSQEIYALGGINGSNFRSAVNAGASGICVMSSAMECKDEREFIAKFT